MILRKVSEAMRPQRMIVSVLIFCLGASGCRMPVQITRNLIFETCLFTDDVKGKVYYCWLAQSAWKSYRGEHPDCAGSSDFAKGFKRGYADFLEYGGDCCFSHPVPPQRYWKVHRETPEGRASTVAWLDGFRAGAGAAKASGYRELVIVPVGKSSLPPNGPPPAPPPVSPINGPTNPGTASTPPVEELPGPRPMLDAPLPPPPPLNDGR